MTLLQWRLQPSSEQLVKTRRLLKLASELPHQRIAGTWRRQLPQMITTRRSE